MSLAAAQRLAESRMATPCRVSRPDTTTGDPVTGADVPTAGVKVYAGGCKIQDRQASVRDVESAQAAATVQGLEVHLPVASGPYRVGDVVRILDRPDGPAAVVLRKLRVVGLHLKTHQTAQRLPVEEMS